MQAKNLSDSQLYALSQNKALPRHLKSVVFDEFKKRSFSEEHTNTLSLEYQSKTPVEKSFTVLENTFITLLAPFFLIWRFFVSIKEKSVQNWGYGFLVYLLIDLVIFWLEYDILIDVILILGLVLIFVRNKSTQNDDALETILIALVVFLLGSLIALYTILIHWFVLKGDKTKSREHWDCVMLGCIIWQVILLLWAKFYLFAGRFNSPSILPYFNQ